MSENDIPFDVDEAVRSLPIDVPGFGTIALGDMTAEHHAALHASIARDVFERTGRFVNERRSQDRRAVAASRPTR